MATSEKVKFSSARGNKFWFTDRFCGTCGENVSDETSIEDNEKKDMRTFEDYYMLLNSEKKRFPASSTITAWSNLFKKVNDKTNHNKCWFIRAAEDNELSLVKESQLPVQVKKFVTLTKFWNQP